jgi:hypothetical protein
VYRHFIENVTSSTATLDRPRQMITVKITMVKIDHSQNH